ncbi:unnamed protein product [Aspergillus oryzae]|nr:unnamed protein product [Aspergillus oryzae]
MTLRPFSRAPSFLSDEPEKPLLSVLKWCCIDLENGLPLPLDNTFKLGAPLLHDITSSDFPDVSDTSAESADSKALAVSIVVPSSQIKNQRQYRWSILQTILETEPAYQELEEAIEQSITDLAEAIVPPEATIEDKITTDRFPTLHPMLPKDKQTSLEASLKEFLPKQAKTRIPTSEFSLLKVALPAAVNSTEAQTEIKELVKQTVKLEDRLVDTNITDKIAALALQIEAHKADKGRALERNTKGLAERIVKEGTDKALAGIPTARFGSLMTADRQEKESFRAIANLVTEYLRSPKQRGGERVSKPLTFHLSQFREYHDLVVAFHTVRDSGLSNEVPLVLFDEFDNGFGQTKLGWLQYLLAPMQDGKFLEDGHQRPLGSAIFVFIGGTCSTFENFTTDLATKDAKKPDFCQPTTGVREYSGVASKSKRH